jgi:hypothetical protein
MFNIVFDTKRSRELILVTETKTKAPTSVGPYPKGLYSRKRIRVLINFEQEEEVKDIKTPPWLILIEGTPFGIRENVIYLRYLLLEVLEEDFFHDGIKVDKATALKHLPARKESDELYFGIIRLNNILSMEI